MVGMDKTMLDALSEMEYLSKTNKGKDQLLELFVRFNQTSQQAIAEALDELDHLNA